MKPVEIELLIRDRTEAGARTAEKRIGTMSKEAVKAQAEIDAIQRKIRELEVAGKTSADQTKNIAQIDKLKAKIVELQKAIDKASNPKIKYDSVQQATTQVNQLGYSVQQVARELPSLAYGPQIFFSAISNNLPILADNIQRARAEYNAFVKDGKSATPVWKQLLSSVVSWQTLLVVGVTVLTVYGKEIWEWAKALMTGNDALKTSNISMREFHATMAQGAVSAQDEVVKLELLYGIATDVSRTYKERSAAVKDLQNMYPAYFANLDQEQIALGKALSSYEQLRDAIYKVAEAKAAEGKLVDIAENQQLLENTKAWEKYNDTFQKVYRLRERKAEIDKLQGTKAFNRAVPELQSIKNEYAQLEPELNRLQKELFDELENLEGGEDLVERIKDYYEGDLDKFIRAQMIVRDKLLDIAKGGYTPGKTLEKSPQSTAAISTISVADTLLKEERKLEDDRLAIMQDGFEKRRREAQIEFDRQIHDIEERRRKLLETDKKETGGANTSAIKTVFDAQTIAAYEQYSNALMAIEREQQDEQAKIYNDLLLKYETYQQKRLRIATSYDKDIKALASSPDNQIQAEEAKEKALAQMDIAFAQQFPEFERWANTIATYSIDKLRELAAAAQAELDNLEGLEGADPNAIAKARAAVASLQQGINKVSTQDKAPSEDDYKSWAKLTEVLREAKREFKEIGDTIDGTLGEIIDTAGTVAVSTIDIISGIQKLSKSSSDAIEGATEVAAKSMSKLETASVLIKIISAAFQVISAIAKLFKGGESSMERNLRSAREFNDELRVMNERAHIDRDQNSIFGDAVYTNFKNNISVMRDALRDLEKDKQAIMLRNPYAFLGIPMLGNFSSLEDSIGKMQVQIQHSTWFRSAKYTSLKDLIPELFGDDGQINMEALKAFADENNAAFQKLSKDNQDLIKALVSDWETYEEALDSVRDYLSSIFGEIGNSMLEALISVADGTSSMTDAVEDMANSIGSALRQMAKDMVYAMTLKPLLDEAQKQIEEISTNENMSDEEKFAAWTAAMDSLFSGVAGSADDITAYWDKLKEIAAKYGISLDDPAATTTQSGKAGAMHTVSQDSFSRMEGILTSIQLNAAIGNMKLENISTQMGEHLRVLNGIHEHTEQILKLIGKVIKEGLKVK